MIRGFLLGLAGAAIATTSFAHVTLETKQAPAGANFKAVLRVSHGQYQPMMPKGVTLVFFQPATGIEPLRREAVDVGDYTWRVENIVIPTPGRWRLRIEILLNDFEKLTLEDDIQIRP